MADDAPPGGAQPFALPPDHVRDAGQYTQQTAQALADGIRSADSEIQGLMATWKGRAADAYLTGWDEARDAAIDVLEALETMAELLGVTVTSFEDLESGSSARVASTGAALDIPATSTPTAGAPTLNI
ncbi:WXG100 family type VII secretion target [Nocardia wallacei]|uniref:WXG100 family type VII secretion target n=1 Tax=Nocardia wallacei TaxID=480035 RepID=UPI0024583B16|nr:WXG100 family type VII secretion target [Nocardia wallacei]